MQWYLYGLYSTCSDVSKTQAATINSLPGTRWICKACRGIRTRTKSNIDTDDEALSEPAIGTKTAFTPDMFDFMRSIKTEMQQLRESVDFCSNKITDFEANLTKINEYFKKTDNLKTENIKLKQDI